MGNKIQKIYVGSEQVRPISLRNASFDESDTGYTTANIESGTEEKALSVKRWTPVVTPYNSETWVTGGAFQYSDSYTLAEVSHPTTGPSGETTGGCLGVYAARSSALQYTQDVYLTAGSHTLTFKYYVTRVSSTYTQYISSNLCGVTVNGTTTTTSRSVSTSSNLNTWKTASINFTVSTAGTVTVSLGYKAANKGSNYCPRIFFDDISIS